MIHSESIKALAPALLAAQRCLKIAIKDSQNPHLKSRYADLTSVWDAAREALHAAGLVVIQSPATVDRGVELTTTFMHAESGEWLRSVLVMPVGKADAQSVGSAITYARRYSLASLIGVLADDDDGEGAVRPQSGWSAPAATQPRQAPVADHKPAPGAVGAMMLRVAAAGLGGLPAIAKEIQDGVKAGVFDPSARAVLLEAYNARKSALMEEREPGSDG